MISVDFDIPDALLLRARSVAESAGMSFDEFVTRSVHLYLLNFEGSDSTGTDEKEVGRERLREILANAPDVEPEEFDRLN